MNFTTKKIVSISVLSALSIVLMMFVHIPILPWAPFLKYEPADVPVIIGSFIFGPLTGLIITLIVCLVQTLLFAEGGLIGLVMHILATGTLALIAGLIYRRSFDVKRAAVAAAIASICVVIIMIPANLLLDPMFYGMPYEAVKKLIVPAILPFNLIKMGVNSTIAVVILKAVMVERKIFKKETA